MHFCALSVQRRNCSGPICHAASVTGVNAAENVNK